jgi:hypothetical protein
VERTAKTHDVRQPIRVVRNVALSLTLIGLHTRLIEFWHFDPALFGEVINEGIKIGVQKAIAVDLSDLGVEIMQPVLLHRVRITLSEKVIVTSVHRKSLPGRKGGPQQQARRHVISERWCMLRSLPVAARE